MVSFLAEKRKEWNNVLWKKAKSPATSVFLVLCCRLSKVYVHRYNKSKSLWLFGATHPIRKYTIFLTTNQYFEIFVILTILTNCVVLALSDQPDTAEYIFTAIYTLEMIFKIIARGFIFDKLTYLRDPWNWLDFSVVVLGYATLAPGANINVSGIRTFRVLRALRAISAVQGLKTMVNALLRSMRMLSDVLILTAFFICVFALVGLQLFVGKLRSRCVARNITIPHNSTWQMEAQNESNWYTGSLVCGNNSGTMRCPRNYSCIQHVGPNPNYGYTSYDNFGWALLTSFQLLTLDYWEDVYFHILSSLGPWYTFYFIFVIFFGAFLVFNLMLAVVAVSYQQEAIQDTGKKQYEQLIDAGFIHSKKRCSCPEMIFDGPVMETIKSFPESKSGASVITVYCDAKSTVPTKLSVGKLLHVDREHVATDVAEDVVDEIPAPEKTSEKSVDGRRTSCEQLIDTDTTEVKNEVMIPNGNDSEINLGDKLRTFCLRKKENVSKVEPITLEEVAQGAGRENIYSIQSAQSSYDENKEELRPKITYEFRAMVYLMITSPRFEVVIVIFILINTVCLALEYHGMSKAYKRSLNMLNHVFTVIFILEMILKLIALGGKGYLKSRWNIFDGVVVTISVIDLIYELSTSNENGDFTIIRSLRLFRVLKIANSWPTMRLLLSAMGRSINALANLTVILGIVLYMFAVVGTQIFAKYYRPENFPTQEVPDWNFNNFGNSFLVIFRILCGEWVEPLYDCMLVTGLWTPVFFIAALIIGNFLILNLFLALLLGSFAALSYEEEMKNYNSFQAKLKWRNLTGKFSRIITLFKPKRVTPLNGSEVSDEIASKKRLAGGIANGDATARRVSFASQTKFSTSEDSSSLASFSSMSSTKHTTNNNINASDLNNNNKNNNLNNNDNTKSTIFSFISKCCPKFDMSQNKFTKSWASVRDHARKIKDNRFFDYFILSIIFASSFILIFEDIHLPKKPKLQTALEILDIIFCVLFVIEFFVKVMAMGVVLYIKNGWNLLDFLIIVASLVSIFALSSNLKTLRSIRTLRALRPLQAVSRWSGVKMIVNSLIKAIPSIANVVLVCMMFWLIFSILGVQFFGGKFFKCVDEEGNRIDALIIPNRTACLHHNSTWKNSAVNFDNALNGFLALFQVATFEGWIEVMRDAVDATGVDKQPAKQHNMFAYIFFIIFVIIGSFVILNLFISVMIDNFYALKKQQDDYGSIKIFLSQTQKKWLSTVTKSMHKKPRKIMQRPLNYYHGRLFDILCSAPFEALLFILISLNMVIMMLEHYQQSELFEGLLLYSNIVFTTIFAVEMVLKLIAFRQYFINHIWNVFDFVIVILSITELILQVYGINLYVTLNIFRVARVLRIGRLLRFFDGAKGIRRLLHVLINSSASVLHMALLLFLLLFIYSIVGMTNFGYVKKTGVLNAVVNFETFGSSILLLLRVSTSAGWNEVLDALMIEPPDCEYKSGDCPVIWVSVVFFVSYILFSFLVVVNMHIAIILENFNEAYQESENGITDEDLEMYYAVWQLYDPDASQFVAFEKVPYLVANLGPPLGLPFPNKLSVHNLNLPLNIDDKVHCINLLQALIRQFYTVTQNTDSTEKVECAELGAIIDKKRYTSFPILLKDPTKLTSVERLRAQRAASLIIKNYRLMKGKERKQGNNNAQHVINVGEATVCELDPIEQSSMEEKHSTVRLQSFDSSVELRENNINDRNNVKETGTEVVQIHNVSPIKKSPIDHSESPPHTLSVEDISDKGNLKETGTEIVQIHKVSLTKQLHIDHIESPSHLHSESPSHSRYHSDGPSPTGYHRDGPSPRHSVVKMNEQKAANPDDAVMTIEQEPGSDARPKTRNKSGDEESVTYSVPSEVSLNLSTYTLRDGHSAASNYAADPNRESSKDSGENTTSNDSNTNSTKNSKTTTSELCESVSPAGQRFEPPIRDGVC